MNEPSEFVRSKASAETLRERISAIGLPKNFIRATGGLVICFSWPLFDLARFSVGSELFSHIILIPFVSVYLAWSSRASFPPHSEPNRLLGIGLMIGGVGLLAALGATFLRGTPLGRQDSLVVTSASFVLLFGAICALCLGRQTLRAIAFPLGFLVFLVPIPTFMVAAIESFLQHGSAHVAGFLFKLVGTPVFRQELVFQLPGIRLQVAPECSGIHSSLALLITSVLAGYFFLRSPVNRVLLAVAVIPLALMRNGFRVFTIGELCVHISPNMIDSYIHHHGGPIFFALSLVPFFALLYGLFKLERRKKSVVGST